MELECPLQGWTWQEAVLAVAPPDLINPFRKAEADLTRIRNLPRSTSAFCRVENFGEEGGPPDPAVMAEQEMNRLWSSMVAYLAAELFAGRLSAKARPGSNLSAEISIRANLWDRIRLINGVSPNAVIKEKPETYLYDLRIFPSKKARVRQASSRSEKLVQKWLVDLMNKKPHEQEHERSWYFEEAGRRFGMRSQRSFDRAVKGAKELVPQAKWFQHGPRKGSPQNS
jgi:hypothetical protein